MHDLVEDEEILILQRIAIVLSVTEDKYARLFDLNSFTVSEDGISDIETGYLAEIGRCRNSKDSGGFSNGSCVVIVDHSEIVNKHVHSIADGIQIIEGVISQRLVPDRDVAPLREEIEDLLILQDRDIPEQVVPDDNCAWVLNLHGDQLRVDDRVLKHIVLHREDLCAIEVVHVVDREHQAATIQVLELVLVYRDMLCAEVRIAHRLRMHINEGSCLHVHIGYSVKYIISQDEVVEG